MIIIIAENFAVIIQGHIEPFLSFNESNLFSLITCFYYMMEIDYTIWAKINDSNVTNNVLIYQDANNSDSWYSNESSFTIWYF